MNTFYDNLGANISLGKIIYSTDITNIITAMNRELSRRSKSTVSLSTSVGVKAVNNVRNTIRN
jgi:hypothetical protein